MGKHLTPLSVRGEAAAIQLPLEAHVRLKDVIREPALQLALHVVDVWGLFLLNAAKA